MNKTTIISAPRIVSPTSVSTTTSNAATIKQTGQPGCTPMIKLDWWRPLSIRIISITIAATTIIIEWDVPCPMGNTVCSGAITPYILLGNLGVVLLIGQYLHVLWLANKRSTHHGTKVQYMQDLSLSSNPVKEATEQLSQCNLQQKSPQWRDLEKRMMVVSIIFSLNWVWSLSVVECTYTHWLCCNNCSIPKAKH